MKDNNIFQKYYSRLVREGVLKSVVCGLAAGFGAMFITALFSWIFGFDGGIWLAIGLFIGLTSAVGVALYFIKFKPTAKQIARRVDALGLEERAVTMLELEHDNSYLAMRQREDARERLAATCAKNIKIKLSTMFIVPLCISLMVAIPMTTVMELAALDILPSGVDLVKPDSRHDFISVSYFVDEGGEIDGEADQILSKGANATPVMAVPDEGWVFVGWDDGVSSAYREDINITGDIFVMALFEQIEEDDPDAPGTGDMEGGDDQEGNLDPDQPGSSGSDGEVKPGDGDGEKDGVGTGSNGSGDDEGGKGQGDGAGGKYDPDNSIIDGDTYYGDELKNKIEQILAELEANGELTPEDKAFIEKYFAGL